MTGAAVPDKVEAIKGQIACATAMAVERAYAAAIRSGRAPGNGGGGPVKIRGWTCQGFAPPLVLQTGKASQCVRGGTEILEGRPPLPSPSGPPQPPLAPWQAPSSTPTHHRPVHSP